MAYTCVTSAGGFYNGCADNEGAKKHLIITREKPGNLAVSDLANEAFINQKIIADGDARWYILRDIATQELTNDEIKTWDGTFKTFEIGKTTGTDVFKFETSQCLRDLAVELDTGGDFYIAYITEQKLLEVQTIPEIAEYVRFRKVRITAMAEKTTGEISGLVSLMIKAYDVQVSTRLIPFADLEEINELQKVIINSSAVSDSDLTVTFKVWGCNLITPIADLTVGADGVNKFEFTRNGVADPGAVAFVSGNTYTFTPTAGAYSSSDVITVKYQEPSASS